MKKLILVLLFIAISISPVYAKQVNIIICDPPTTNEDGSPLDDIKGFTFYCGTESINTTICNANLIDFITIDGLHTCVVTASDVWDNESGPSNIIEVLRRNGNFFGRDMVSPGNPISLGLE